MFFFFTKIYVTICSSWIEESNIKPYVENRDDLVKNIKNNALKEAVKRIDEYLSDPEVRFSCNLNEIDFDLIICLEIQNECYSR